MYELLFRSSNGSERMIAQVENEGKAIEHIHAFCEARDFKIYYTRMWTEEDGRKWFDVGSHTEFFILSPLQDDVGGDVDG